MVAHAGVARRVIRVGPPPVSPVAGHPAAKVQTVVFSTQVVGADEPWITYPTDQVSPGAIVACHDGPVVAMVWVDPETDDSSGPRA